MEEKKVVLTTVDVINTIKKFDSIIDTARQELSELPAQIEASGLRGKNQINNFIAGKVDEIVEKLRKTSQPHINFLVAVMKKQGE